MFKTVSTFLGNQELTVPAVVFFFASQMCFRLSQTCYTIYTRLFCLCFCFRLFSICGIL